jgi:hypothetical protein
MPTSAALPLKHKLLLLTFGILLALLLSTIALQFIPLNGRGTTFNTLSDLRRALTERSGENTSSATKNSDVSPQTGNISLRAIVQTHPNDSIIYTLRPNLNLRFVRANVTTNSCGMRSPERPLTKDPGTYRIALLGDSFAFGWGVEQSATFAQRLEDNLNRMARGEAKFEVLNFGVPGYSTFQEVALFEERGLEFNPDAVLVYFVQNDFGMPFFVRDLDGSGGIFSSITFLQIGKKLFDPDALNRQITRLGLDPNRALERLAGICQDRGLRCFLTINPRKSWKNDLNRLPSAKRNPNMRFIPLRQGLLEFIKREKIPERDLTLSFDPHPSEVRHAIIGGLLAPYFLKDSLVIQLAATTAANTP